MSENILEVHSTKKSLFSGSCPHLNEVQSNIIASMFTEYTFFSNGTGITEIRFDIDMSYTKKKKRKVSQQTKKKETITIKRCYIDKWGRGGKTRNVHYRMEAGRV